MGRATWHDVPTGLRAAVEDLLGDAVVSSNSQAAGFSPGGADRLVTRSGRRAFVKTIARGAGGDSIDVHRREATVLADLPPEVRAPRLVGVVDDRFDDVEWVALVIEDVDGVHPGGARDGAEITAVLDALDTLPAATGPLAGLPRLAEDLRDPMHAWDRMLAQGFPDVVPARIAAEASSFATAARSAVAAIDGEHLVHGDCRADNLLVDRSGAVWVIDWPWACIGAPWIDALTALLDVLVRGESADVDHHVATHPVFRSAGSGDVDAFLAGLAGMFFESAARPAPPGIPTLRDFQRREAEAAAEWFLARRNGRSAR